MTRVKPTRDERRPAQALASKEYAHAVAGINERDCERLNRALRRVWNLETYRNNGAFKPC